MGWRLVVASLDSFLLQANIHKFEDLLEFAMYNFNDYCEMNNVLFCLEYIEQIIDIKVLAQLCWELDVQGIDLLIPNISILQHFVVINVKPGPKLLQSLTRFSRC
jgi:hypothetical protein